VLVKPHGPSCAVSYLTIAVVSLVLLLKILSLADPQHGKSGTFPSRRKVVQALDIEQKLNVGRSSMAGLYCGVLSYHRQQCTFPFTTRVHRQYQVPPPLATSA
jgi:hypothetical protein